MYSPAQLEAIRQAQEILQHAGLQPTDLLDDNSHQNDGFSNKFLINYTAPKATLFTSEEIAKRKNRLTMKSYIDGIVDHPAGAILEYPQTGDKPNMAIGHKFRVDPQNYVNPRFNVQYSLGDSQSIHHNVQCFQLLDPVTGDPMKCEQTKLSCRSIKSCSFNPPDMGIYQSIPPAISLDAAGEVFMKTMGFFCALTETGCAFMKTITENSDSQESDTENDDELVTPDATLRLVAVLKDVRSPKDIEDMQCRGSLLLKKDKYNHYYIRCEHYTKGRRNHLHLHNLNEYNIGYLEALFQDNYSKFTPYEVAAAHSGYGPLYPCSIKAAAREQKQLCPMWHRYDGVLKRGQMVFKEIDKCDCRVEIYEPNDLSRCPYIFFVSRNPHSHASPPRSKTPLSIELIFNSLLQHLEWRLADATPRRILLDNTFIYGLRKVLSWTEFRDPGLGDLHPSFINSDHAARLINNLRYLHYPQGTGLKGAELLLEDHKKLPSDQQYLRCVKTCENAKDGTFHIVICMFRAMSHLLMKTTRPTIDTAFKRLDKWQEFEMEAWFPEFSRSVVVARAFTTCQSAEAHQILFRLIFEIAQEDTGQSIQFRHIHGSGIDTITADGHEGQALGLGLYCKEICEKMTTVWSVEWEKWMNELTPVEHLACFYLYCLFHYTRNVKGLRGDVQPDVISAMLSLASADPLPDFGKVVETICNGGTKALNWYKNKEKGDGLTLSAIYRPKSKIPLEIWKAAPSTSNGNEQAHRNINRDGTRLTMLAGIMRGLQFDSRAMSNINLWLTEYIPPRDQLSTHFRRAERAVRVKTSIQQRSVLSKDVEILTLHRKAHELQTTIIKNAAAVTKALESAAEELGRAPKRRRTNDEKEQPSKALEALERAQKRLQNHDEQLTGMQAQLETLLTQGSGSYTLTKLSKPEELYDRKLLKAKPEQKPAVKMEKGSNSLITLQNPMRNPMLPTSHERLYAHTTPSQLNHQNFQSQPMPPTNIYGAGSQLQNQFPSHLQGVFCIASQPQSSYPIASQSQHVFRIAPHPQNPYPTAPQPQNGYYVGSQPQNPFSINSQRPTGFYQNSQVDNRHEQNYTHPQNMIHHPASHFGHFTGYSGPHAHPHNPLPRQSHYRHPENYSHSHSSYH